MTENLLSFVSFLKIISIAVFALLYSSGGISGKWKRRIIAPVTFIAGIVGFSLWTGSFKLSLLYSVWLLFVCLTIGYGATFLKDKIIKRGRYGLACSFASISIFATQHAWDLFFLHIAVVTATSVVAGVWNNTSSARAEETLIGASIVTIPYFVI